jgi:hypothetical protein
LYAGKNEFIMSSLAKSDMSDEIIVKVKILKRNEADTGRAVNVI